MRFHAGKARRLRMPSALPAATALLAALGSRGVGAWLGDLAEPALCCCGGVSGEREEEALARLVGLLRRRPLEDFAVQVIGFVGISGRRGNPARWTRAWAATHGAWAASAVASACRSSSSALRRSPFARATAPSPARAERGVVAEPDSLGELERAPVRIHGGCLFPASLGRPRFEQHDRGAERLVADHVRMTAGDRDRRSHGRDIVGMRRADCANEAARCHALVVSSLLECRGRVQSAIVAARSASPD